MFKLFKLYNLFKKTTIGLDIQPHAISLMQLQHKRSTVHINYQACSALPAGVVVDGHFADVGHVVATVSELVRQAGFIGRQVVIALPASRVISQWIQLPAKLPRAACYQTIANNLQQYFPGILDELCFDYVPGLNNRILLVAVRKEQLQQYMQAVLRSGLNVCAVDIDIYALIRAIRFLIPKLSSLPIESLLDLSGHHPRFVVLHQEEMIFYQEWDHITIMDSLTKVLDALRYAWQLYGSMHAAIKIHSLVLLEHEKSELDVAIHREWKLDVTVIHVPETMNIHAITSYGLALRGMR